MASTSLIVNCGPCPSLATLRTPPVAVILIQSAPFLYRCLTALYASSGLLITPSFGPGSPLRSLLTPLVGSAWPPVVAMDFSAVYILGPMISPLFIALRKETLTPVPPKSLTVVKPAIRVRLQYLTAPKATSDLSCVNFSK